MNRGHSRDTHAAGDARIQQICPIPMGVHDVRLAKLEQPTNLPPLPEVRPMGNQDGMHRHSPCPEGANDGIAIRARVHDHHDGHTHAFGVKPEG